MFEVLLTLCLAADPGACRTERHPGGDTRVACLREAAALVAEAEDRVQHAPQDWPCVPAGHTPGFAITEIAPGVFVHKGHHAEANPQNLGDIANLGFVIGRDAVAVIDTGGSLAVGRALLAAIRERTDLPIPYVILTHMHPDHVLGTSVFVAEGAEVIGHAKLEAGLAARAGAYLDASAELIGPGFAGTEAPRPDPDLGVADTRTLDLGGRVLELRAHPTGHTDNDLTVLDRITGTLFLGDLVFQGHLPAIDGSLRGWQRVLADLSGEDIARAVPGHGPVSVPWPDGAAPTLGYLDALARETAAAIEAGETILAASERIGPATARGWLLGEVFGIRNATAAFSELEWE